MNMLCETERAGAGSVSARTATCIWPGKRVCVPRIDVGDANGNMYSMFYSIDIYLFKSYCVWRCVLLYCIHCCVDCDFDDILLSQYYCIVLILYLVDSV